MKLYAKSNLVCIVVLTAIIMLLSCAGDSDTDFLLVDLHEYVDDGEYMQLTGSEVPVEILGAQQISVCDDYLIVNTSDRNAQVTILDVASYEELASICPEGQARTDFTEPSFELRQFVKDTDGHSEMVMTDNWSKLKFIDLDESVAQKRTVVDRVYSAGNGDDFVWDGTVFLDGADYFKNVGLYYDDNEQCYKSPKFICVHDSVETEIPLFGDLGLKTIDFDDMRSFGRMIMTSGRMYVRPDKSKVLYACNITSYLNIFDMETKSVKVLFRKGGISFSGLVNGSSRMLPDSELMSCGDCATCDDFFILLYLNEESDENGERLKNPSVRVMDWEGNLIGGAELDQCVGSIAYDAKRGILFGLDQIYETIYAYDLNGVIRR